jgi:hypothetical protein
MMQRARFDGVYCVIAYFYDPLEIVVENLNLFLSPRALACRSKKCQRPRAEKKHIKKGKDAISNVTGIGNRYNRVKRRIKMMIMAK